MRSGTATTALREYRLQLPIDALVQSLNKLGHRLLPQFSIAPSLEEEAAAMPTPEEKYYDGMNTLFAPVRWAKGFMQFVLIVVGVILFGLGLPIYCLVTGTHMELWMWELTTLVVLGLASFCLSPWYTGFSPLTFVACSIVGAVIANNVPRFDNLLNIPPILQTPAPPLYDPDGVIHITSFGEDINASPTIYRLCVSMALVFLVGIALGIGKHVRVRIALYRFARKYVWFNSKTGAIRPYRDFPPDLAFDLVEKSTIPQ